MKITEYIDCDINYCTLDDAIERLTELKNQYGGSVSIDIDTVSGYYDDHSARCRICVEREETPEELAIRQARAQQALNYERQQYERLRAKFEGK